MAKPAEVIDAAPPPQEAEPEPSPFVIPAATSLQERPPRTLKHGDTFAVFDHHGDAVAERNGAEGLYHRDTRHLSRLELTLGGARPILLSSTLRDNNAALTCDLTNPDLPEADQGRRLVHDHVHVRRTRFLWEATCYERLTVRNFDDGPLTLRLGIAFGADFADVFEVRGTRRARRGNTLAPVTGDGGVTLRYRGRDEVLRATRLRFDPVPNTLTASEALFDLVLAPGDRQVVFVEIGCGAEESQEPLRRRYFSAMAQSRRALRHAATRAAGIATSNELFDEAMQRSISDIYTLITDTAFGPYPYAGIPWFSTVFGRDAIITALQTLWFDPDIARGVLGYLAANQSTTFDAVSDAEPGKILHEERRGEMAELGEVPFRRYYGSIDSTPLFVMLAGAYLDRTGDVASVRALWPNLEAALAWIDQYGDRDGDGFVEYGRRTDQGLANQGWKDSEDSVFHADRTLAKGPIALSEVQAYVYGALTAAARIAQSLGMAERAAELHQRAGVLRMHFDEAFFDAELGTYVLALDGDKAPCRVRSSNAGHVLFTGLALPERAAAVVASLTASSSFSGWGVRTIASTEARYNPMSYHNGSVWPHDNALIAAGFARYGFRREAARLFEGLFAASTYIELRRLPELFCGFARLKGQGPTFYPVACSPQAWAAATPLSLIQSCLGLGIDVPGRQITFDEPVLPAFLDVVELNRLACGGSSVDVVLRRSGASVLVDVIERRGPVRVVTRN